jgi:hypothetical protein
MIKRLDAILERLQCGDVKGALEHVQWRAFMAAQVPEKSVDPVRDFKECLNRYIKELTEVRADV